MSEQPPGRGPEESGDDAPDAWDAWRTWSAPAGSEAGAWDAWKTWRWDPSAAPRRGGGRRGCGCGCTPAIFTVVILIAVLLFTFGAMFIGEPRDLPADDLIAAIDALPATGPRDQRPPDTAAGETTTFPAPGVDPGSVASQIQAARMARQRQDEGGATYLLYEEATVAVYADPSDPASSEVVVFEDNREASRRYPILLAVPGWSGALDDFDSRASSRGGGIGGFRGGGGGVGK